MVGRVSPPPYAESTLFERLVELGPAVVPGDVSLAASLAVRSRLALDSGARDRPLDARSLSDLEAAFRAVEGPVTRRTFRRLTQGRLDPRSAMRAELAPDDDRLFRRTTREDSGPGRLEVVVLLDRSWRTLFAFDRLVATAEAIVEAAERAGHRAAVVAFGEAAKVLKRFDEPAFPSDTRTGSLGSRNLLAGLETASALFEQQGDPVLFVLTFDDAPVDVDLPSCVLRFGGRDPSQPVATVVAFLAGLGRETLA